MSDKELARLAIANVEMDLVDRRGLRQAWESIGDHAVTCEILGAWTDIVERFVAQARAAGFAEAIEKCKAIADRRARESTGDASQVNAQSAAAFDIVDEIRALAPAVTTPGKPDKAERLEEIMAFLRGKARMERVTMGHGDFMDVCTVCDANDRGQPHRDWCPLAQADKETK